MILGIVLYCLSTLLLLVFNYGAHFNTRVERNPKLISMSCSVTSNIHDATILLPESKTVEKCS